MAYKNLLNVSCSSAQELFRHIKDYLISRNGIANYSASGLGWTLHDSYYAGGNQDAPADGDWVVVYSAGEDGKQDLYYRLVMSSLANSLVRQASGLFWNASTDAWVRSINSGALIANGPTTGSAFTLWIFGDLSSLAIIIGNGTNNYGRYFGLAADTMHDATVATTSGSVTAGSNKVLTLDAVPSSWSVGKAVHIRHTTGAEKTTISAIASNQVTVSSLANGYSSGAKVALDHGVLISSSTGFLYRPLLQISHAGTTPGTALYSTWPQNLTDYADPDPMSGYWHTNWVSWYGSDATDPIGYYGRARNIVNVSASGITSGQSYQDESGQWWRALSIIELAATMYLFKEV